jgi:tRNA-specific 2-thiouridylase
VEDARATCETIGIPHYVINLEERFGERVIDRFVRGYLAGETPNPCVLCNQHVKFDPLLERARTFGCEWVATGHYARLAETPRGPELSRAADETKDQSYALWSVARATLRRTMMPLGGRTKRETREIARDAGLPVAEKVDSQDICFVPDGDYARFVASRAAIGERALSPGPLEDVGGRRVGTHEGVARFTIGQRRGIGVPGPEALYVVDLDAETNTVTVGPREALAARAFTAREVNWVSIDALDAPREVTARIRYRHRGTAASVTPMPGAAVRVTLESAVDAITPGQSVVFYDGDVVLGGGIIHEVLR